MPFVCLPLVDGVVAGSMVITFSAVYRTDKGKATVTPVSMLPAFKVYRRLAGKGQQRLLCNCLAVPAMNGSVSHSGQDDEGKNRKNSPGVKTLADSVDMYIKIPI
jgi:hypothetical protein